MLWNSPIVLILLCEIGCTESTGFFDGPNIALGKSATQLPGTYCIDNDKQERICYNASLAVDGIIDQGDFEKGHCSHTNVQRAGLASWTVNFETVYTITGIVVYNRVIYLKPNVEQRLRNFTVVALGENLIEGRVLYNDGDRDVQYETWIPLNTATAVSGIKIQIPRRRNDDTILTLCEVQVFSAWCSVMQIPNGNAVIVPQTGENINGQITAGTVFQIECESGYKLISQENIQCSENGTYISTGSSSAVPWVNPVRICQQIVCPYPPQLADGKYKPNSTINCVFVSSLSVVVGCRVIPECNEGFMLSEKSEITCQQNGSWSGGGAECVIITCPPLNKTEHVQYTYNISTDETNFPLGTTVNVTCTSGNLLEGSSQRQCTETATWDGYPPKCENLAPTHWPMTSSAIIGGVTGGIASMLIVVAVIVTLVIFKRRKKLSGGADLKQIQSPSSVQYADIEDVDGKTNETVPKMKQGRHPMDEVYANTQGIQSDKAYYSFDENIPRTAILVKDLADLVLIGKSAIDRFQKEFENFLEGMQDKHSEALKSKNRGKNRYKGLYAYDNSRVVLEPDSNTDSDYINACYINGFKKIHAYIASQGPTTEIIDDFWRMVWQTKSSKIVMLTNLTEANKPKCDQYWPNEGSLYYGNVIVTLNETDIYSDFVIRRLTVKKDNLPSRIVTQFHFIAWPDKGVPKYASSLVQFRHKVKYDTTSGEGPIIVHCSAGVGRTGTFIALDYLTHQAKTLGYVDVAGCVEILRKQRVNLVQTLEQYIFVHQALLETLMLSSSALPSSQFQKAYSNLLEIDGKTKKRKLDKEFEILKRLSPVAVEDQYALAKDVKNRNKNRYSNVLPVEEFMPRLTGVNSEDEEYVNAAFLSSYKQKKAFIIMQTPLESTVEDFWKLVWEYDIHTIVMINSVKEMKSSEIYWPGADKTVKYGNIAIAVDNEKTVEQHHLIDMTVTSFLLKRNVRLMQCGGWDSKTCRPESPKVLLSLLELVQSWQQQTGNHTILVHCMNGAEKSGLYCVISAVIERMKVEQDVAISQIIEEMRNARVQIISTVEQYQFCHEVVLAYIQMNDTYSNFTM